MKRALVLAIMLVLVSGCSVGTEYSRPKLDVPEKFRGTEAAGEPGARLPDWWDLYGDENLSGLIREALAENYDARTAAARIEEFRAAAGISRIAQLPQVSLGANVKRTRSMTTQPHVNPETSDYKAVADVSYELDLWGRLASLGEAARDDLLSTEYAAEAVRIALVSDTASAYFDLLALDRELLVARQTVANREKFLDLTRSQYKAGAVSMLDVGRAESSLSLARAALPDLERQAEQTENLLSSLLGRDPGPIRRPAADAAGMPSPPDVPAGLPSGLLERRPDVRQAEAALMAANARVNATKALRYPTITLTGEAGIESATLRSLLDDPSGIWSVAAGLLQPIINSARTGYQVDAAEARREQAALQYKAAVLGSFREVSDALAARARYSVLLKEQRLQVEELRYASDLALTRYKAGYSSYFEVIDADGALFSARLGEVQAARDLLVSTVQLYKALGGGWDIATVK